MILSTLDDPMLFKESYQGMLNKALAKHFVRHRLKNNDTAQTIICRSLVPKSGPLGISQISHARPKDHPPTGTYPTVQSPLILIFDDAMYLQ